MVRPGHLSPRLRLPPLTRLTDRRDTGPLRAHIDVQASLSDFESTPRRIVLLSWIWLSDVTEKRAPFLHVPGSHKQIGRHWESSAFSPALQGQLPRCKGVFQHEDSVTAPWQEVRGLPPTEFAAPQRLTARRGQVSFICTAMLHSGSALATVTVA